jgi:cardiolipin synthase
MDSLGSRSFFRSEAIERLRDAGVEIVEVLPVNPLRALFVRLDLRDHRKIAVIDRGLAYTGSMNIADPRFFKQNAGVGEWVDAMVRIEGPAAWALEAVSLSLTALQTGGDFAPPQAPRSRSPTTAGCRSSLPARRRVDPPHRGAAAHRNLRPGARSS